MATVQQCEQALQELSERLDDYERDHSTDHPDRSLGCTMRDLDVSFTGRLRSGHLRDIAQGDAASAAGAQIRVDLTSDDLVALVAGKLDFAPAWLSGRIKIHAGMRDLIRLRTLF